MPFYIADTNFFVQAHRMHYPLDVVPGFWRKLIDLEQRGLLVSLDKVRAEIVDYKDALSSWLTAELPATFFKATAGVLGEYARVTAWAMAHTQ